MSDAKAIKSIEDLLPDPHNVNAGTARGLSMVEDSLRHYGAGRSILADKNGVILAGNKTHEVAATLGLPVRVVQTDGRELVVVQRTDLDLATDRSAKELAIADNRASEVGLAWDVPALLDLRESGVNLGSFFSSDELGLMATESFEAEVNPSSHDGITCPNCGTVIAKGGEG